MRLLTWFAIAGGPAAWAVHLLTAWSVNELSCLAPASGGVALHDGSLGTRSHLAVWAGTLVPLLVALGAVAACVLLTRSYHAARREEGAETAILERTNLLLVLGWFLSLMSVAAIVGGGIALLVLEPCA
jgi:hypothetical protein